MFSLWVILMSDDREQTVPTASVAAAHEAAWHTPLELKLVALLFILGGVLGVTESLLGALVHGGFAVNVFALIWLCSGIGLLRWHNGWRRGAIVVVWLYFAVALVMVVISTLHAIFPLHPHVRAVGVGPWRVGLWFPPFLGMLLAGMAFWMYRVLSRPDIVWRFKNRHLAEQIAPGSFSWNPLRWRFSLGSMFVATAVVAVVLLRATTDEVRYVVSFQTISNGGRTAELGLRRSRFFGSSAELVYVVLSQNNPTRRGYVESARGNRSLDAYVRTHNGEQEVHLPAKNQLFEVAGDRILSRTERVTKSEFDSFMSQSPAEWTIDALLKHAEMQRASQAATGPRAN